MRKNPQRPTKAERRDEREAELAAKQTGRTTEE
jgi:hypothetical protein